MSCFITIICFLPQLHLELDIQVDSISFNDPLVIFLERAALFNGNEETVT